jgi:hypothetical protein
MQERRITREYLWYRLLLWCNPNISCWAGSSHRPALVRHFSAVGVAAVQL